MPDTMVPKNQFLDDGVCVGRPSAGMPVVSSVGQALDRGLAVLSEIKGTAGSNVLIILISFGASLLAARLLGPDPRGTLAAAVVYAALASAVADVGLNQAVPYFAARHRAQAPAVLGTTCVLALGLGAIAALGTFLLFAWSPSVSTAVLYYLPSIPFGLLTTHMAGYMYGGGMLVQFNVVRTLQPALLLLALGVAAVVGRPDPVLVLACAAGLSVLLAVGAALTIARQVPLRRWRASRSVASGLLGYALRSYIGNLCWLFNSRLDQLMMSVMLSAAALGIYATSASYAGVVFSFFSAFAMLAFAKASALEAHEDERVPEIIRSYLLISLILGVPTALGFVVAAPWLYPLLFGEAFSAGVLPAMVLSVAGVILGLNFILSNGLRIRNRPLLPSIAEGAGLAVSAVGLTWALPALGIMGAAWVSLASYVTVLVILLSMTRAQRMPAAKRTVRRAS